VTIPKRSVEDRKSFVEQDYGCKSKRRTLDLTDLIIIYASLFNPGGHPLDRHRRTSKGVLADQELCLRCAAAVFISVMIVSFVSHGPGALVTGPMCHEVADEDAPSG
jgi:hypothetical protein